LVDILLLLLISRQTIIELSSMFSPVRGRKHRKFTWYFRLFYYNLTLLAFASKWQCTQIVYKKLPVGDDGMW